MMSAYFCEPKLGGLIPNSTHSLNRGIKMFIHTILPQSTTSKTYPQDAQLCGHYNLIWVHSLDPRRNRLSSRLPSLLPSVL